MTWSRVPIFGLVDPGHDGPVGAGDADARRGRIPRVLDRTVQTAFYVTEHGGSSFLLGEPLLVLRPPRGVHNGLPGFGIVMEMMPVFTRKPLFAYRVLPRA